MRVDGIAAVTRRKERQAEEFAAGLLVPAAAGRLTGARTVAARYGIPASKAAWALGLLGGMPA